jgi:branched-subunit amino acid aminotransferase/4-amino-4-deoxychorismate lyase
VGLLENVDVPRLADSAEELARHNHQLLSDGDDLGLSLFVTPGPYSTFAPADADSPTVGMHTYPLPFHLWAQNYKKGQRLVVSDIRQVPSQCWPAELKCRSRMHYYLADRQAALVDAGARAVLLDLEGHVIEASTANLVIWHRDIGLISPPRDTILPGVSVAVLEELAGKLDIPFIHRSIGVEDLRAADEVLLSSTSPCVWPVVAVDGLPIGKGQPGTVFQQLLDAWSDLAECDVQRQAEHFANRTT